MQRRFSSQLRKKQGAITITGKNGTAEEMIKEILSGDCDLYLGKITDDIDPRLHKALMIQSHHSIFAHADHPFFQREYMNTRISIADLSRYKWIIFGSLDDIHTYDIPESLKKNIEIETINDVTACL